MREGSVPKTRWIKMMGKVGRIRGKLTKEAMELYMVNHGDGYFAPCQHCGKEFERAMLSFAHQIPRSRIAPGIGEALTNGWAMCLPCHQFTDGHPLIKNAYMEQNCNLENGLILDIKKPPESLD